MKKDGFAVVTGGSRGIGKALSIQLASEGYNVVINYVSEKSESKALETIKEIDEKFNRKAIAVRANVAVYEECKSIVEQGVLAFGDKIAVLVNNAGIADNISYLDITPEQYTKTIHNNLLSQMHCVHLVLPYMVKQNYGCIVNVSSVAGIMGAATQIDYSASKAGIIGMTKAMAKEFGQYNISVNSIAPGIIWTDMVNESPPESVAGYKAITPLGKIGDVKDMSDCLSYVVNAEFLTGQTISPNGGLTI